MLNHANSHRATLAGLVIFVASGVACDNAEEQTSADAVDDPTPTVEEVVERHPALVGETVTLYGEADEVYGKQAFVLEGNQWIFDHDLLVLTREPIDLGSDGIEDDDRLAVTGMVKSLVTAEMEKEIDWDLDTEIEAEFENKPVLVADSITAMRDLATWTDDPEPVIISTWGVYSVPDPKALDGRSVDFTKTTVMSKTGKALWVGDGHANQLLVAPPKHASADVEVGDMIMIDGELKLMPDADEALKRWSIDATLKRQLAEEPLYVAATTIREVGLEPEASAAAPPTKAEG